VVDNGIGIRQEDMGKLFKLFGFLDTTKELNTKGIGLGLHISKMIC
jgi:signal transduction histidine kinase